MITNINSNSAAIPNISIIVVNWNLKEHLQGCLESIRLYGGDLDVETIVVDNASSDGSCEMVESQFPEVSLIRNAENIGFSRANNQALEMARGRYFFLLNNDAVLHSGALPGLVDFMDANAGVGACGPHVVNEDGTLQVRSKGRFPSIGTALGHFFVPSSWQQKASRQLGFYEFADNGGARPVDWVSGCALMVRREAVESAGPLDSDVFMYCEDVDWCYRMNRAGWKIYYVPSATVTHYAGKSMMKQKGKRVAAHKNGLISFYAKHHGFTATTIFRSILWLGYSIHFLGWLIQATMGRREGVDRMRRVKRMLLKDNSSLNK